jgi:hypothetical protein
MFKLARQVRYCTCLATAGKYLDRRNAVITKQAVPIGISNPSLLRQAGDYLKAMDNGQRLPYKRNLDAWIFQPDYHRITVVDTLSEESEVNDEERS